MTFRFSLVGLLQLGMRHILKPLILFLLHSSISTLELAFPYKQAILETSIKNKNEDNIHDMTELNRQLEERFAQNNTLSKDEWLDALPTDDERREMTELITFLWNLDTFDNVKPHMLANFKTINKTVNMTKLEDIIVIHEKLSLPPTSRRFWGYIALRQKATTKRRLHHSAPHFQSDGPVCHEAAYLFQRSDSRSLTVAGANRFAVNGNVPSLCQPKFKIADAAHNCQPMFQHWNTLIANLSDVTKDIFIQWHGMAEKSCKYDVFISAGTQDYSFYEQNIPAVRFRDSFNKIQNRMKASTPNMDPVCKLTATSNVFGRYLNGVTLENVCGTPPDLENIHGAFVHVEQRRLARESVELWNDVIRHAFPENELHSI